MKDLPLHGFKLFRRQMIYYCLKCGLLPNYLFSAICSWFQCVFTPCDNLYFSCRSHLNWQCALLCLLYLCVELVWSITAKLAISELKVMRSEWPIALSPKHDLISWPHNDISCFDHTRTWPYQGVTHDLTWPWQIMMSNKISQFCDISLSNNTAT